MPKAYSADMRERVIAEVEGGASRREAAEELEVSASTAIVWVKCFRETGRCAAKPRGGSISPLEKHADFLLGLIEKQSDLTLDQVVLVMRKHRLLAAARQSGACSSVTRSPSKKACARRSKSARMWRGRADAGCENRACLILRTLCSSTRPPPIPRWCG